MIAVDPIRKEMYLQEFLDLVPASDRESIAEIIIPLLKKEKAFNIQHRIQLVGQEISWALTGCTLIGEFFQDKSLLRLRIYDITKLKEKEVQAVELENRFHISSELSGQIVYNWDINSGLIEWAGAIESMTGYTPAEFQEVDIVTWATMVHPDDIESVLIELRKSYEDTGLFNHIYRFRKKNDTYIYIESRGVCFRSPSGNFHRMECVMEDIQKKRLAEDALKSSEKRFKSFYNLSNEAMFFCEEKNMKILDANKKFREMFLFDKDELSDLEFKSLFISESLNLVLNTIRKDDSESINVNAVRKNGTTFPAILKQDRVEFMGRTCIFISLLDISTYKEVELLKQAYISIQSNNKLIIEQKNELENTLAQLKKAQTQLVYSEKMAALGQLIASIAHEINNPIGAINASSLQLEENLQIMFKSFENLESILVTLPVYLRDSVGSWIQKSIDHGKMLFGMELRHKKREIQNWLESKQVLESEYLAENICELGMFQELEIVIGLFRNPDWKPIWKFAFLLVTIFRNLQNIQISNKRVSKIVFALKSFSHFGEKNEKSLTDVVQTMETVLTIYSNQMRNHIELFREYDENIPKIYCFQESLHQAWTNLIYNSLQAMKFEGRLIIRIRDRQELIVVEIEDNGPGIPLDIRERIFEPFFTTKPSGEGSGLGLGIVKNIIEKHSGTISYESIPGKTVFRIQIPKET